MTAGLQCSSESSFFDYWNHQPKKPVCANHAQTVAIEQRHWRILLLLLSMSTFVFTHNGMSVTSGNQYLPLSIPELRKAPLWREAPSCDASKNLGSPLWVSDCESLGNAMMTTTMHGIDYTRNIMWNSFTQMRENSGTRRTRVSLKINI